jgi:hypothetical protein
MNVHVERDRYSCKFWLEPLTLASDYGFPPQELGRIQALIRTQNERIAMRGSNTANEAGPFIREVQVTDDEIVAVLSDGRKISVPLAWSWRLSEATQVQRANFRLIGGGEGVHWPDVDEDISVSGMLHGIPATDRK